MPKLEIILDLDISLYNKLEKFLRVRNEIQSTSLDWIVERALEQFLEKYN